MPSPTKAAAPVRRADSGYALLMVFLLAALIAISLYSVMPKVTFESQRDQEQMLIDRGGQYKRAIQLYFHKFRRYPAKMEDLVNSNGQRFLRQKYNDPLTGKNEWRLIHVGPGGALTDSLTQKSNAPAKDAGSVNNFITELKPMGDDSVQADSQVPIGMRHRPSDPGGASPGGETESNGIPVPGGFPTDNNVPPAGGYEVSGAPPSTPGVYGTNGLLPGVQPDAQGYVPGGEMNPNAPISNATSATSLPNGAAAPTTPNDVIRNLLTSPRPGGPPPGIFNPSGRPMNDTGFTDGSSGPPVPLPTSVTQVGSNGFSNGSTFGGGQNQGSFGTPVSSMGSANGGAGGGFVTGSFAGVASTVKRPSIKIYNDHQKYNEWEFIYDYGKEAAAAAGIQQNGNINPLAPGQQPNQPGQQNQANPFSNSNSFSNTSQPPVASQPQTTPNQ